MENYYILRKNGEIIFLGEGYKNMRDKIPDSIHEHKGDIYDFLSIFKRDEAIEIVIGRDVANTFMARYDNLNQGKFSSVKISKKDLTFLLKAINF